MEFDNESSLWRCNGIFLCPTKHHSLDYQSQNVCPSQIAPVFGTISYMVMFLVGSDEPDIVLLQLQQHLCGIASVGAFLGNHVTQWPYLDW